MSASRTKIYNDNRNGKWHPVSSGIADYTGFDVTLIRIGMFLGTIFGSGTLLVAYLVIAWVANAKPLGLYGDAEDTKFWQTVRQSPARSTRDVRSKFRDIDRRLADVETYYTSRNSSLANEIDSLR